MSVYLMLVNIIHNSSLCLFYESDEIIIVLKAHFKLIKELIILSKEYLCYWQNLLKALL